MTTPAGHVNVVEYHHPNSVMVERPICLRCHSLIVATQGEQILLVQSIFAQAVKEALGGAKQ